MNNKAINEFDFRRIRRIKQISEGVVHRGPRTKPKLSVPFDEPTQISGFWVEWKAPLSLGLLALRPSISSLLQSVTSVITKCDNLSRSSERILIWCPCGTKADIYERSRATADQPPLLTLSRAPRPQETELLWTRFRLLQSHFRADVMLVITFFDFDLFLHRLRISRMRSVCMAISCKT